jgi:diguanylate cyclase (GGDEF)-like protein
MVIVPIEHWRMIEPHIQSFASELFRSVEKKVLDETSIKEVLRDLQARLRALTGNGLEDKSLDESAIPLVKLALSHQRRANAFWYERSKDKISDPALHDQLDAELRPLDEILRLSWLRGVRALRGPRLADYLTLQRVEEMENLERPKRQYDDKFHLLQSSSVLLQDLNYSREQCARRNAPVTLAFLDIDDFKQFNNDFGGETGVDRNMLPMFMRALEAHVYEHGHAYRFGGDEYLLLLPNMGLRFAVPFCHELQEKLSRVRYRDINRQPTVSIGLCEVDAESPLTDQEARERANKAKTFAKNNGKDCVATYRGDPFY